MAGQLARLCAAMGIAAALAGCSPTAAPQNKGSATAPIRNATSHATRGTDQALRRSTTRGGYSATQHTPARTGSTFFGLLQWPKRSTNPGTAAGTTRTTQPAPATGGRGPGTAGLGLNAGMGVGRPGMTGASRTRHSTDMASGIHTNRTASGSKGGVAGMGMAATGTHTRGTQTGLGAGLGAAKGGKASPLHVVGFFTVDSSVKGLTALGQDPRALSYLAPWWYTVRSDGSLHDMTTAATKRWVTAHKLPVAPLVTNGGQFAVLQNDTAMKKAVQNITAMVKQNNYAGVNVDFQGLPSQARSGLNAFVDDLSHNLRPMGKTVTIDIIPTLSQTGSHGAYDEVTLAKYADQIVLMTYDHHDNSSPPGPVSPHDWVVSAVKHALQAGVPAKKIILGVNTYGYDWNTATGKAYTVPQKVATTAPPQNKKFDAAARETKVTYVQHGQRHIAYYGGLRSLTDKLQIARKYGLYGIAIWKVGYETPAFWKQLVKENGYASTLHGGKAANSGVTGTTGKAAGTGTAGSSAGARHRKGGVRPMTHRPIGSRTGHSQTGGSGTSSKHSGGKK